MELFSKKGLFPWVSIFAGLPALALQSLLFSCADTDGLLPAGHFAGIVPFVLLAIALGICAAGAAKFPKANSYDALFPVSVPAAAGMALAAAGMGVSAFTITAKGLLGLAVPVLGICAAVALGVCAYFRAKGIRPHCLLWGIVTVYLIFRTLVCCQGWGSQPQLQLYFFPMLACLFLLMACYYRAELGIKPDSCRRYVFFGQSALFCCLIALATPDRLFYLSAALWLATDLCAYTGRTEEEM